MEKNNQIDSAQHAWYMSVKRCLDVYGFSDVWMAGGVGDEKLFLKATSRIQRNTRIVLSFSDLMSYKECF